MENMMFAFFFSPLIPGNERFIIYVLKTLPFGILSCFGYQKEPQGILFFCFLLHDVTFHISRISETNVRIGEDKDMRTQVSRSVDRGRPQVCKQFGLNPF